MNRRVVSDIQTRLYVWHGRKFSSCVLENIQKVILTEKIEDV